MWGWRDGWAFCRQLFSFNDPLLYRFNQSKMRSHWQQELVKSLLSSNAASWGRDCELSGQRTALLSLAKFRCVKWSFIASIKILLELKKKKKKNFVVKHVRALDRIRSPNLQSFISGQLGHHYTQNHQPVPPKLFNKPKLMYFFKSSQ